MDPLLLVSLTVIIGALTFIAVRIWLLHRDEVRARARTAVLLAMNDQDAEENDRRRNRPLVIAGQRRAGGARHRRPLATGATGPRRRLGPLDDDDDEEGGGFEPPPSDDEDGAPSWQDNVVLPDDGKVGKKKMAKLQAKAEKRAQREAETEEREDRKKRDAERESRIKKEEEKQKREEAEKEQQERIERQEREQRELEEYLKLKEAFTVEEEGFDEEDAGERENLMKEFIDYVKRMKVVNMDDLAAHFKLKTSAAVDRIRTFVEDGTLTGVIDDRGKFIYITVEELEAVAKFINQRGRVSVAELAEYSNKLIRLEPEHDVISSPETCS